VAQVDAPAVGQLLHYPQAPAIHAKGIGHVDNGVEAAAFVCYLDAQALAQQREGQLNQLRGRQPGVLDAVAHDLRDDKGAALTDIWLEPAAKPLESPSCIGGGVQVRRE
jgi:hypothetical protein